MRRFLILLAVTVAMTVTLSAATLTVPPIDYKQRTLANGLEVYTVQDRSTPTVAIQVWYRVGSKSDPEGRSGFAHLFEHIMFKGTKHMADEQMDRLTEDVGGYNNAGTQDDATQYYEVVPSNYLETLLWAEGDRMAALEVNDKNFKSERDVVKEEYRYRILAPSYGKLFYAIDKDSFTVHPYKRPGIGSIEDLDASTLADVQQFHATFYRPDNAVLVVVGDFEQQQLDSWIDRYLGAVPRPAGEVPRVTAKEPQRTEEKRFHETGANVPLPAVAMTWLLPEATHPDHAALTVAGAILGLGESSRLNQSLVYRQQVAQEAQADDEIREDDGLFVAFAILAGGKTPDEGEKALRAELQGLIDKAVPQAELDKVKNLLVAATLHGRETGNGRAADIGSAVVLLHDAAEVNRGIAKLQAVTAADVQRVMRKYVGDGKAVVIHYTGEPQKPAAQPDAKPEGSNQ
jgi:zinc protease